MENTSTLGGMRDLSRHESLLSNSAQETESMEFTTAAGTILPPIEERTEPQSFVEDPETMQMDLTRAVGGILRHQNENKDPSPVDLPKSEPGDIEQVSGTSVQYPPLPDLKDDADDDQLAPSTQLNLELENNIADARRASFQPAPAALENGSPTLQPRLSARRMRFQATGIGLQGSGYGTWVALAATKSNGEAPLPEPMTVEARRPRRTDRKTCSLKPVA